VIWHIIEGVTTYHWSFLAIERALNSTRAR
jgi:hypothetical protein